MKRTSLWILFVIAVSVQGQCVLVEGDQTFNLTSLASSQQTYWINVCQSSSTTLCGSGIGVCQQDSVNDHYSAGSAPGTLSIVAGALTMTYSGGTAAGGCSSSRQSIITFTCDPSATGATSPAFSGENPTCTYNFVWTTAAACPTTPVTPISYLVVSSWANQDCTGAVGLQYLTDVSSCFALTTVPPSSMRAIMDYDNPFETYGRPILMYFDTLNCTGPVMAWENSTGYSQMGCDGYGGSQYVSIGKPTPPTPLVAVTTYYVGSESCTGNPLYVSLFGVSGCYSTNEQLYIQANCSADGSSFSSMQAGYSLPFCQGNLTTVYLQSISLAGQCNSQQEIFTQCYASVTGVTPLVGPLLGGNNVTITGLLLGTCTGVTLAGVPATILSSSTELLVVQAGSSLSNTAGPISLNCSQPVASSQQVMYSYKDVCAAVSDCGTCTNTNGCGWCWGSSSCLAGNSTGPSSPQSCSADWRFLTSQSVCFSPPSISSIAPTLGPYDGGNNVTIVGISLGNGTDIVSVSLAGVTATIIFQTTASVMVLPGGTQSPITGPVIIQSLSRGVYSSVSVTYSYTLDATCRKISACNACTLRTGCGWCRSSSTCMAGDSIGPTPSGAQCSSGWYDNSANAMCSPSFGMQSPLCQVPDNSTTIGLCLEQDCGSCVERPDFGSLLCSYCGATGTCYLSGSLTCPYDPVGIIELGSSCSGGTAFAAAFLCFEGFVVCRSATSCMSCMGTGDNCRWCETSQSCYDVHLTQYRNVTCPEIINPSQFLACPTILGLPRVAMISIWAVVMATIIALIVICCVRTRCCRQPCCDCCGRRQVIVISGTKTNEYGGDMRTPLTTQMHSPI